MELILQPYYKAVCSSRKLIDIQKKAKKFVILDQKHLLYDNV
jgi:hypothetical protein